MQRMRFAYMTALVAESGQNCSYSRLVNDPGGPNEIVLFTSYIAMPGGTVKKTLALGLRPTGQESRARFTCKLAHGGSTFTVDARDLAGSAAHTPLGSNMLTVR